MTKEDDAFDCYCFQAAADATLEAVIRELTGEARLSGGFVAMFGPPEMFEGLEEEGGKPPAPALRRGPTVLPRCPDPDWWPPST